MSCGVAADKPSTPDATTLVLAAAFLSTAYPSNEQCITSIGNFARVIPYFTATRSLSAGDAQFAEDAIWDFASYISQPQCDVVVFDSVANTDNLTTQSVGATEPGSRSAVPGSVLNVGSKTSQINSAVSTVIESSNTGQVAPPTTKPTPKRTLTVGVNIAIGLAVFFSLVMIIGVLVFGVLKRRRRHRNNVDQEHSRSQVDQPYLQHKGELEADERAKYELHGESVQAELGSEASIYEMTAGKDNQHRRNDCALELRGDEHCKELE